MQAPTHPHLPPLPCRVYQALQRFTVLDLSSFYLDAAKDRLYVSGAASTDRRACQTVLAALLEGLLPLIAPLLPHMAEDAWQNLPYARQEQSGGLPLKAGLLCARMQLPHLSKPSQPSAVAVHSFSLCHIPFVTCKLRWAIQAPP